VFCCCCVICVVVVVDAVGYGSGCVDGVWSVVVHVGGVDGAGVEVVDFVVVGDVVVCLLWCCCYC